MKLLLDQNLSPALVRLLADVYPACAHVRDFGLGAATDEEVWDFARANGFAIVSKDNDFHQRSFLLGAPPKVLWLRVGNCPTTRICTLLRQRAEAIAKFEADANATFLALS